MHRMLDKPVEGMYDSEVQVRASSQSEARALAAEFLPAKSASETFALAPTAAPIESDFRVVRRCSIWKS
jgi:hypothetical protein